MLNMYVSLETYRFGNIDDNLPCLPIPLMPSCSGLSMLDQSIWLKCGLNFRKVSHD